MKSFQYKITSVIEVDDNLAALLVRETSPAKSEVILECNGKTGDAKCLFSIKEMKIKNGDDVAVLIEGEDETETAENLEKFFHKNL
ncbi:MAG: HPr family phosphocarrier protein [Lachnospiraceae bacterium]|nr:HPr family phosphocarrier protein [Lachnospiraceae bacterium]